MIFILSPATSDKKHPPDVALRRLIQKNVEETVDEGRTEDEPARHEEIPRRPDEADVVQVRRNVGDVIGDADDEHTSGGPDARDPNSVAAAATGFERRIEVVRCRRPPIATMSTISAAMVFAYDEPYLDVGGEHQETGNGEHDAHLKVAELASDDRISVRYRKVDDCVERPADSGEVGADDDDCVDCPDDGDGDVAPMARQDGDVLQRLHDDEALESRHKSQMPDGTEDAHVPDASLDEKRDVGNRKRSRPGHRCRPGVDERAEDEIGYDKRPHDHGDDVLASLAAPREEHHQRDVDQRRSDGDRHQYGALDPIQRGCHNCVEK